MLQEILTGLIVGVALYFLLRRLNRYRQKFAKKAAGSCGGCSKSCVGCPIAPSKK